MVDARYGRCQYSRSQFSSRTVGYSAEVIARSRYFASGFVTPFPSSDNVYEGEFSFADRSGEISIFFFVCLCCRGFFV